ncbi:MAG: tetratricopeptide repeat protein [Alphaproteobacteria bacterium]|nr:tetratricopeptide repeat protein [Alphaproteobacteria bacterium]
MSNEAWLSAEISFAKYLVGAGRLDLARDSLTALGGVASPLVAQAWNELGSAFFSAERYRESELSFRNALQQAPGDAEACLGLGYSLFNENRLAEAEAVFKELTGRSPSAAAWRALSAAHLNLFDNQGARQALQQALACDPKDAESHALKGLLAYRVSDADRRWRDWTRQNLYDPGARPNLLGSALTRQEQDEALESIRAARQIDPRIRTDELGARMLVARGQPEAALAFLEESPVPDACTWQWMADVSWLLRNETEARAFLRRSLEARMHPKPELRPLGEENESLSAVLSGLQARANQLCAGPPLVWVHWDAPVHFTYSIASSVAASPGSPLVVIGDKTNAYACCRHAPILRGADSAWGFLERYRHASENDFVYEAFCLMRWFLLKDWAEAEGEELVVPLDSDVLLVADVEREVVPLLGGRDFAFTGPMGTHLSVLTKKGVAELCSFFMKTYAHGIPEIHSGQISDMTLLPHFLAGRDWVDLSLEREGKRVDMNIRLPEGFGMADGIKDIHYENGHAFAVRDGSKDRVRLLALHFQGPTKGRMIQALRQLFSGQ